MSLGFSVEALLPAGRGGGALRMGLSRVAEADWLDPAPDRAARAAAFAACPDSVLVRPGAEVAGREAARMVGAVGGLAEAAAHVHEDLCLLQPAGEGGRYLLTAGALAWPTDWRLSDKIGLPLAAVHAPIHGYAEQLAAGVDHFVRTLAPGPVFGRTNWFVVPTAARRYLPADDPATRFAHVTAANAGATLFVRCERQTLRRLPETGAVLFAIGIYAAPLDALSPAAVARVAASVDGIGAGEHARRAAPFYADALRAYAAAREPLPEAAE
jgi:dimethylamine monooxygenase subunit A